jgi:hypothetical protein
MKLALALKAVEVEKNEVAGDVFDEEAEEGTTPSKLFKETIFDKYNSMSIMKAA